MSSDSVAVQDDLNKEACEERTNNVSVDGAVQSVCVHVRADLGSVQVLDQYWHL